MTLVFIACAAHAQNKVVVVPMSGDDLKPLANIITVAKANGDFNDPVEALMSITDASAANPYLVVIAPGEYTLTERLTMKPYVNVSGSGPEVTRLLGSFASSSQTFGTVVVATSNSRIENLTIQNTGSGANMSGIYGVFSDFTVSNVHILVEGNTDGTVYGMIIRVSSWTVSDSVIESVNEGAGDSYGIYGEYATSRLRAINTTVVAQTDPISVLGENCSFVFDSLTSISPLDSSCD
ncbi:hypothetical protein [Arenicella xantha]|nr:hypothetical protein [Arenicella xantha]